jgi:spartin
MWQNNSPTSSRRASQAEGGAPPAYVEKPSHLRLDTKDAGGPYSSASPHQAPQMTSSPATHSQPQSAKQSQRPFWNRVFLAAEVVGSSLEATAQTLITSGTNAAADAAG